MSNDDIIELDKLKARRAACTVLEWFENLEELYKSSDEKKSFEVFQTYVNNGLRLQAAPPGYVGNNHRIHKGDISCAVSNAKRTGKVDAPDILVPVAAPVTDGTWNEYKFPLHELWIVRTNLQEVCQTMGMRDLSWPTSKVQDRIDEEIGFEIRLKIGGLRMDRDRIADMPARDLGEERWKKNELNEIDRKVAALEAEFDKALPPDGRPIEIAPPKTAKATKAKIDRKALRKRQLKTFLDQIERKLQDTNHNWNLQCIPVTKADFSKVARRVCSGLNSIADRTIINDLGEFDVSFQHGTRHRKDNILEKWFPCKNSPS